MEGSIGAAFALGRPHFGAIRVAAALLVFGAHCYPLAGSGGDPIGVWLRGATDGSSLAVAVFFVISGFLVTRSALERPVGDFLRARALRVWPALAVCVTVTAFGIGLCSTELPRGAYLANRQTWDWLRNAMVFDLRPSLPSVFAFNPYPVVVNGSLWTLPVEVSFYLALPFLAVGGGLRPKVLSGLTALCAAGWVAARWAGLSELTHGPFVVWDVPLFPALDALLYFLAGAILWVRRENIPRSPALAAAGVALCWASLGTASTTPLLHVVVPYTTITVALAPWSPPRLARTCLARMGDWSYGIYLYAFPVQQAVMLWHGPGIAPHHLACLALPPVLLCAGLSWHLVERPALRLKHRPRRNAAAIADATVLAGSAWAAGPVRGNPLPRERSLT